MTEAQRAAQKRYREKNRDILTERQKARYRRLKAEDPETFRRYYKRDYANDPDKYRVRERRNKYGIEQAEWLELFKNQDERCAICRAKTPRVKNRHWHTDHCHNSKKIRGILCHPCNTGLGLFGDDVEVLSRAVQYLRR
jgi:hypothetical protein